MNKITIEEIQTERGLLATQAAALVEAFENKTGIAVSGLYVCDESYAREFNGNRVKVRVELPEVPFISSAEQAADDKVQAATAAGSEF